ncbi:MAG TPA: hypothetical protein PKK99_13935 [Bacteroidia bacterium]|nr:hypothetical protein [Bacteroidia bacterium]HNQ00155.1 hypothetical protein [Bacteroidia bacterium]
MKKILFAAIVVVMASGCHDYKADVDKLQQEKTALSSSLEYKDSTITDFLSSFNEIENNLAAIDKKQTLVAESASNGELKSTQKQRILENIQAINDLMSENKKKIAALSASLKKSNIKITGFQAMIEKLNLQIEEKDKQMVDLNNQLAEMNTKVEKLNTDVVTLTADNTSKQEVILEQTNRLNQAYYTTGTFKELQSKQVMKKEGGVLGIGATKKVNSDFNKDAFTAIDITKVQTIPVEAKDARILTNHPSESYTIEHKGNQVNDILITNPEKFWAASKYLVVVVDK